MAVAAIGQAITSLWARISPIIGGKYPGALGLAVNLAVPVMRTAGFFQNRLLEAIYGRPLTAKERFLAGSTSGWPVGANPFFIAFLSGFAYPTGQELAEGWLSAMGELILSPAVESDLEDALRGATTRNFWGFMDAVAEMVSESIGLEDLAAFFRGLAAISRDAEALTGWNIPTDYLGRLIVWLDDALKGVFDEPWPLPWPGEEPPTEEGEPEEDGVTVVPGRSDPGAFRWGRYPFGLPPAFAGTPIGPAQGPTIERPIVGFEEVAQSTKSIASQLVSAKGGGPTLSLAHLLKIGKGVTEGVKNKLLFWLMGGGRGFGQFPGDPGEPREGTPGGAPGHPFR